MLSSLVHSYETVKYQNVSLRRVSFMKKASVPSFDHQTLNDNGKICAFIPFRKHGEGALDQNMLPFAQNLVSLILWVISKQQYMR